jgi:hypothetical protein
MYWKGKIEIWFPMFSFFFHHPHFWLLKSSKITSLISTSLSSGKSCEQKKKDWFLIAYLLEPKHFFFGFIVSEVNFTWLT